MLAFDIHINDERVCLAGTEDWSLLSAHVTAQRNDSSEIEEIEHLDLYMGGMSQDDADGISHHIRWGKLNNLTVGTKITIHLIETDAPDMPVRRYRSDREVQETPFTAEEIEEMEREEWLRLKAKFENDFGKS